MPKKNLYSDEIVIAKKQLIQLSTLKSKVSLLTQQWEENIGENLPGYPGLVAHVEKIERQIYEQIGSWKKTPAI
ncbi:hypothetical protein QPK13_23075 [Photorhabdus tasmaniensis]